MTGFLYPNLIHFDLQKIKQMCYYFAQGDQECPPGILTVRPLNEYERDV